MNKKGFVFVESIVVLMIVSLSLALLISSYSLISRKTKEKEKYNNASDKYLIYSISNLGATNTCNYGTICDGDSTINVSATKNNCSSTKVGRLMNNCQEVFEDYGIEYFYVVDNIRNILNDLDSNGNKKNCSVDDCATKVYDNGTIEYMKSLKKCNDLNEYTNESGYINNNKKDYKCDNPIKYMIIVFKKGVNNYNYASIEL